MIDEFIARCRKDAWGTYVGDGRIVCRALGQYSVMVDAGDIGLTPNLVCDGYWEPNISVAFERILKPGMTAVDVGANIGYFSLLTASRVGASGKVIAIEANPALAQLLRQTITMNGLEKQIELHNVAGSAEPGSIDFFIPPERNLNGCILLDEWRDRVDPSRIIQVPMTPLDSILGGEDKIDFIKIDVEGGEVMVWKGLHQTLARNPEVTVILEYNFMRHSHAGDLIPLIEAQGFQLREIDEAGDIRPVERESLFDSSNLADRMLFLTRDGTTPS